MASIPSAYQESLSASKPAQNTRSSGQADLKPPNSMVLGLNVFTPRFDFNEEVVAVTMADKINLTHEFLRKIDDSDAIYVIDQDGYTGRSVCIEIGYASTLGKVVILSETPVENAVRALTSEVVAVGEITKRMRP
jgi:hypothetical protein